MEVSGVQARAELGEGIFANCRISEKLQAPEETKSEPKVDLSSLTSMLQARWKGGASNAKPEPVKAGQVRSFRITQLDPPNKKIEVELA